MQTSIEPAVLEDLPQMTELLRDLFSQERDFIPDPGKQERGLRLIIEQPSRGRIFVLRGACGIMGMMNLLFTISTAEGGFVVLLEDMVIRREFRGQGFGTMMLQHAIEFARQKDFLRVTLLTDRLTEESSQQFFRKNGFVESNMLPMRLILSHG